MMISAQTAYILNKLNAAGYEAFVVGGAVRDMLTQKPSDDIDITTNATPQQVTDVFHGHRIIPTGIQHGTVTILIDGIAFEITTYRTDGTYSDNRHPDKVAFASSIEEDLARRDFTVNAIAYHPRIGLVDPFNGHNDLLHKTLRCVGDANRRFEEDALRIARLIRFAAVLGFDVEPQTAIAADTLCDRLDHVAAERKRVELTKMLLGDGFLKTAMYFHRPLCRIIPSLTPLYGFEQHTPYHDYDVFEHTMRAVNTAPKDLITRLALLFHDIGKPETFTQDDNGIGHFYRHAVVSERIAHDVMTDLRFDNATINAVIPLIHHHGSTLTPDKRCIRRRLHQLGEDGVRRLIDVKTADAAACKQNSSPPDYGAVYETLEEVIRNEECTDRRALAVNGRDVSDMGYPRGPIIGEILDELLYAVMEDRCANTREALSAYIQERWPHV